MVELRRDVEREAVAGDPSGDPDPDRRDLLRADPRTGQAGDPAGGHTPIGADADHHFLDVANVAMHVAAIRLEVDDRVADDLPGTVIRHVAAAAGLLDVDATFRKLLRSRDDVGAPAVAFDSKCNYRW